MSDTRMRIAAALAKLDANPSLFTDEPHPIPIHADSGRSMRDYVRWLLTKARGAKKIHACALVESAEAIKELSDERV